MNKILKFIKYSILRVLLFPITLLVPKNKKSIVFFGYSKSYKGNCKHLFEYVKKYDNFFEKVYFITDSKEVASRYSQKNVIYLYNIKTIIIMLRSKTFVVDSTVNSFIGILSSRKKIIQLWHGNGMKQIALMTMRKNKIIFQVRKFVTYFMGSLIKYDLLYFTSKFAYETRKDAFLYKKVAYNGQPRNDIIFSPREDFNKNILYVPTWREGKESTLVSINFDKIDNYCYKNKISFNIKLHPQEKFNLNNNYKSIKIIDKKIDIYNDFKDTDIMITDYSSIYFDFLLLDKPIIFFIYDKDIYLRHRKIVYEYDKITPGEKVFNTSDLIKEINNIIIMNNDRFELERKRVRNEFYEYQDNKSCERAISDIRELIEN